MEVFRLLGTLVLNRGQVESDLTGIERKTQSTGAKMQEIFRNVEGALDKVGDSASRIGADLVKKVTVPLTAVGGALIALTKKTSDYGDAVAKTAQEVGMSVKGYQELRYALGQCGVSSDQYNLAMTNLNRRTGQARAGNKLMADSLKRLGVDMKALKDGTIDTEDVFDTVIATLSGMEDAQLQAAWASELFGMRVAGKLLPAIRSGTGEINELRKRAHELGIVMSEEDARASEEFGDAIDDLSQTIGGLVRAIGTKLLPVGTDLVYKIIDIILGVRNWIAENRVLVARLIVVGGAVVSIMTILGLFGAALYVTGKSISALGVIMGILISKPMLIIAALGLLYTAWVNDWGGIRAFLTETWEKHLEPVFQALWEWISKAWNWSINLTGDGWKWLRESAWPVITKGAKSAWEFGLDLAGQSWKWLKDTAWPWLTSNAKTDWDWNINVTDMMPEWAISALDWVGTTLKTWWGWELTIPDTVELDSLIATAQEWVSDKGLQLQTSLTLLIGNVTARLNDYPEHPFAQGVQEFLKSDLAKAMLTSAGVTATMMLPLPWPIKLIIGALLPVMAAKEMQVTRKAIADLVAGIVESAKEQTVEWQFKLSDYLSINTEQLEPDLHQSLATHIGRVVGALPGWIIETFNKFINDEGFRPGRITIAISKLVEFGFETGSGLLAGFAEGLNQTTQVDNEAFGFALGKWISTIPLEIAKAIIEGIAQANKVPIHLNILQLVHFVWEGLEGFAEGLTAGILQVLTGDPWDQQRVEEAVNTLWQDLHTKIAAVKLPKIQLPAVETPDLELPEVTVPQWRQYWDDMASVAESAAERLKRIDIRLPSLPDIDPLEALSSAFSRLYNSVTGLFDVDWDALWLKLGVSGLSQRVGDTLDKATQVPQMTIAQLAIKVDSIIPEVRSGNKPLGEAISEVLASNIAIPTGALLVGMMPIGIGWKAAIAIGVLLLDFLGVEIDLKGIGDTIKNVWTRIYDTLTSGEYRPKMPDIELPSLKLSLSDTALGVMASAIFEDIATFFAGLGRRFATLEPVDILAGIKVLNLTPSTDALKKAGAEARSAMESIILPDSTEKNMAEFGKKMGAGIATGVVSAIAGILRNGPALVEAFMVFLSDVKAGFDHLGKEIALEIVVPFIGGFIEGLVSVPAAIAEAIWDKIIEGLGIARSTNASGIGFGGGTSIGSGKGGGGSGGGAFQSGGYTDQVADNQVAGIVHGGEWVMPAWMVRRFPQLTQLLESMRVRGYRQGGLVGYQGGGAVVDANATVATVDATIDVKVEKSKLQQAMDVIKKTFEGLLDMLPEGARTQVQTAIDYITDLINSIEDALGELGVAQEEYAGLLEQAKAALSGMTDDAIMRLAQLEQTFHGTLSSMATAAVGFFGDMGSRWADGTFSWSDMLLDFASLAQSAMQSLFGTLAQEIVKSLVTQDSWLVTTLANIAVAVIGFLQQAYAALVAFFWWMGPLAPVAAGGVIAAAVAAIAALGGAIASKIGGAISGGSGKSPGGGNAPSPGRQISEITGPTRDLLITTLSPLASLDGLVGVGNRIYDLLDERLPMMGGQLAVEGVGSINVNFAPGSVIVQSMATDSIELTDELVDTLGEKLAESIATGGRGQGR